MSAFFPKADVNKHPFRLSPNVRYRPKADIQEIPILALFCPFSAAVILSSSATENGEPSDCKRPEADVLAKLSQHNT